VQQSSYQGASTSHLPLPTFQSLALYHDQDSCNWFCQEVEFFSFQTWISKYYSPWMILHQRNLDYSKHCQYAFGTYVQPHNEPDPSNTTAPCTLNCIYLWYSDNEQGGHDLLHLQTNQMIICHCIMPVPITRSSNY
jgi:hypothetical protein